MTPVAGHRTFPAHAPREQLDHILLDGGLVATTAGARQLPLSDHRAFVAELAR